MKKIIALLLVLTTVLGLAACAPKDKGMKVTLWVSEIDGVKEQVQEQIEAFEAATGIEINATIAGVPEGDAAGKILTDVATAPDIFCFAQDQLARLVQAGALAPLTAEAAATVTAENDAGSVAAGSVAGKLYAYPLTSDNGYYLYYDKSVVSDEDAKTLEGIIAACEEAGKKFRFGLENAWYTAAFFFATGCESTWTTNEKGQFVSVKDTFNSDNGLIAMKGMQKLAQSSCYDSNADIFTDAAAIVTGIWTANTASEVFGENLGATKLPTFEVDGTTYQLGSYSRNKLMGVKPQTDSERASVMNQLALWLTGETCQSERYDKFQWGPSNLKVQASEAVQSNISLAALAAQNAYAVPQGNIAGPFWDNVKVLGAVAKTATSEDDLKAGLETYAKTVDAWISLTPEQREAFTVIGGINNSAWGTDFEMTEDPKGTWTSKEAFELEAGTEFKVRQGCDWKLAFGNNEDNKDASIASNRGNYIVETAGKYYIQLVINEDGKTGTINLVPAN